MSSTTTLTSPNPPCVSAALGRDPGRGVGVPLVAAIFDRASRNQQRVPASFVFESPTHGLDHETTAPTPTRASVQLGNQIVIQNDV